MSQSYARVALGRRADSRPPVIREWCCPHIELWETHRPHEVLGLWIGSYLQLCSLKLAAFPQPTQRVKAIKGRLAWPPHLHLKNLPGTSFSNTAEDPKERMLWIHARYLSRNPNFCNINRIAGCSTVSNAFSKSSFKTIARRREWWHWCLYSKLHTRQSWIERDLMKPYWFWCTNWRITVYSLFARSFVISLIEQFSRDIGLKSPTCWAPSILGISVMYESFMLWRQTELSWKAKHRS